MKLASDGGFAAESLLCVNYFQFDQPVWLVLSLGPVGEPFAS